MIPQPQLESFTQHFSKIKDSRIDRTQRHQLTEILIIAILVIICGSDGWTDIELFGQSKKGWLPTFFALPNGVPSHDTFGRGFAALDPAEFQASFMDWVCGPSKT